MSGGASEGDPLAAMMGPLGPALSGMQAGSMVGFMSHHVLGQFDTWLPALDQEKAYLVIPNVESFAADHSLDPRQVRLWATMQELVRHATLRRESVRSRLDKDVADLVAGIDLDPSRLMEKLGELRDPAGIEGLLADSDGLAGLLGGERDAESAAGLEATAAFIAGHGDHVVERAAGSMLPELGAITSAYETRRTEPQEQADQMQQFVGLDLDRARAADGAAFCVEVTRRWGAEALDRVWDGPDHLPDANELTDPIGWAARVLLD
jgi:putative hydrolase